MHQEGEPLGEGDEGDEDDGNDDYLPPIQRRASVIGVATSAPALAIAGLVIGLASLTILRPADEIGDAVQASAARSVTDLSEIRAIAVVQLIAAVVALFACDHRDAAHQDRA